MNGGVTIDIGAISDWLVVVQAIGTAVLFIALLYLRSKFVGKEEHAAAAAKLEKKVSDAEGRLGGRIDAVDTRLNQQAERLNAGDARFASGDARFDRLDDRLKVLPTADDVHRLALSVEKLSGQVAVTNERLEGVKNQVGMVDEFLRKSA